MTPDLFSETPEPAFVLDEEVTTRQWPMPKPVDLPSEMLAIRVRQWVLRVAERWLA